MGGGKKNLPSPEEGDGEAKKVIVIAHRLSQSFPKLCVHLIPQGHDVWHEATQDKMTGDRGQKTVHPPFYSGCFAAPSR